MIKGVNRQIIEIKNTDCPYFERIICCVRPQFCMEEKQELVDSAVNCINVITAEQKKKTKIPPIWLVAGISAASGAFLCFLLMLLLN